MTFHLLLHTPVDVSSVYQNMNYNRSEQIYIGNGEILIIYNFYISISNYFFSLSKYRVPIKYKHPSRRDIIINSREHSIEVSDPFFPSFDLCFIFNEINTSVIHIYILLVVVVFSPKAGYGRNQSPVRRPVWLWHTAF